MSAQATTTVVSLRLPVDLIRELDKQATRERRTRANLILRLLWAAREKKL